MKKYQVYSANKILIFFTLVLFSNISFSKGLNADELKELINDKTVVSETARGYEAKTYYAPDGSYKRMKRGKLIKGVWYIDSDGKICKKKEGESTAACRLIVKKGNVWKSYKIPSKPTNPWKHKGTWLNILDGNPNNL